MTNKSKCLNKLCSIRSVDGLCAVDKLIPCVFQEGRQRTIMANDTSYTVTGTIPLIEDKESKEDKVQNTKEDNANAINFCLVLVLLSVTAAINVATIYLIVKIINEIIGG